VNFRIAGPENVDVSVGRNMRPIYVLGCILALVLTSTEAQVSICISALNGLIQSILFVIWAQNQLFSRYVHWTFRQINKFILIFFFTDVHLRTLQHVSLRPILKLFFHLCLDLQTAVRHWDFRIVRLYVCLLSLRPAGLSCQLSITLLS